MSFLGPKDDAFNLTLVLLILETAFFIFDYNDLNFPDSGAVKNTWYVFIFPFPLASTSLFLKYSSLPFTYLWDSSDNVIAPFKPVEHTLEVVFTVSPINEN